MTIAAERAMTEERVQEIADEFFREGSVRVPGVFSSDEVQELRDKTDWLFEHRESIPQQHVSYVHGAFVLRRGAEADPVFAATVTREPIHSLAKAVLRSEPRFNALNVIRNEPGQAISVWHVDDTLEFPLPDDIERFDARIRMPVFWFTVQVALSDIHELEHGPTQWVPGSHYSGRYPVTQEDPQFDGRSAQAMYCDAGDIYFTNHQAWHRGAPNLSDRTRYVMQLQYAARWADSRFKGIA
ncbi:MAG: phytanoyl-CoA dioxygenase family protein [Armatimonadetes bacterium]|nr:phytanoyl-CoA dioxygenase family protein [Armatimonadota bacterium]MDE2207189.1 phytanoyl-CoA dioxygenase family protein [Armatimonadota bacterium]